MLEVLGVLEVLGEFGELEAGADVFWLGVAEEGDVGADAELFVTVGVGGAVWLWLEPVPGLVAWCPARANASAAPPAPTRMATARTIANSTGRRGPERWTSGGASRACGGTAGTYEGVARACGGVAGTCGGVAGTCGGVAGTCGGVAGTCGRDAGVSQVWARIVWVGLS